MSYPEDVLEKALKAKVGKTPLKRYLEDLLTQLWNQGEGFSGKRPFGNSGWEFDIYAALVKAKLINGSLDDYGYLEDCDEVEAQKMIFAVIRYQMRK